MPIYEYKCKNCNSKFEVFKPIEKKDQDEKCPVCRSTETERLLSQVYSNTQVCNINYYGGG